MLRGHGYITCNPLVHNPCSQHAKYVAFPCMRRACYVLMQLTPCTHIHDLTIARAAFAKPGFIKYKRMHAARLQFLRSRHAFAKIDPRPMQNAKLSHFPCPITPYVLADLPLHPASFRESQSSSHAIQNANIRVPCILYILRSIGACNLPCILRFRGSRSSSRADCETRTISVYGTLTSSAHESRVRESRSSSHARNCRISRVPCMHGYPLRSRLNLPCIYAWFPRILSFRESRSSCMAMQSKMRNCLIFRVPWILGYPLRSRLNPPCIPRRAFAKVDPRCLPECETVAFCVPHDPRVPPTFSAQSAMHPA